MSVFPALVMLATVCPSAPVPKAKATWYFPTTVGAKSEFASFDTSINKASTHTETVTEVEVKDGTRRVTVEYTYDANVTSKTVWLVTADGVTVERPPSVERSWTKWLDLRVKVGGTWEEEFGPKLGERAVYTRGPEEEVEGPAGKFKAVRVDMVWERPKFQQAIRITYWVAPGVGKVKSIVNSGGGPKDVNTTELTAFTPGK